MGDRTLAEKHYDKAFDLWFNRDRKCIKEARAAVKCDPEWPAPHWLLGSLFADVEPFDREAALKEFREMIRKCPSWALLQKSAQPTNENSPPIHRWDWRCSQESVREADG